MSAKRVTLRVPVERLGFHLDDGTYLVEPGEIQLFAGGDARADEIGSVVITEGLRIPSGESRSLR